MFRAFVSARPETPILSKHEAKLQAARLIVNQMAGFIQNKFQYVALLCNVDCHVKDRDKIRRRKAP